MSFFESFEEFCARTERPCSCPSRPASGGQRILTHGNWPWDHVASCPVSVAYVEWTEANAALWDRLRVSEFYNRARVESLARNFR